jgi:hypothetical protein
VLAISSPTSTAVVMLVLPSSLPLSLLHGCLMLTMSEGT